MKSWLPLLILPALALGQEPNPTQTGVPNRAPEGGGAPLFQVTVVSRTTKAINYHHRAGSTRVDFRGTALMPRATGEAKVESKTGVTKVEATMDKMRRPSDFGPEYLTFVLWAITPEGRATNLGEVVLNGDDDGKLDTTTELQTFGLIVTAEPYWAVTQPSDVVVMENILRDDTRGTIEQVDAKFELLPRGQYTATVPPAEVSKVVSDKTAPSALLQARNAIQIARWTGAEKYAADTLQKALTNLTNAEGYYRSRRNDKSLVTVAREATQMAEDARIITIRKIQDERLANERAASAERERVAQADAAEKERLARMEAERRSQAEAMAARASADAARSAAEAEERRRQAELEAQRRTQAEAEAERIRREAEQARAAAQADIQRAERAKAEADAARAAALAQQQAAQQEAEKAKLAAAEADRLRQQSEQEKLNIRMELQRQLNEVLQTRETARGLIVNVSDVLFDTAKYTLRPGAREKLAKVAGILLAHPGLKLEVEGHTDSQGSDEYNQRLSEQRAQSVRDYLVQQGIQAGSITSKGLGESTPVASNDTAAGRQQNRRVELVVSGERIGLTSSLQR